jgi:hypothetical protein
MSIEERRSEVIQFCLNMGRGKNSSLWPVITAQPGEVHVSMHTMATRQELEEYINALRKAATAANLPDGSGEVKPA